MKTLRKCLPARQNVCNKFHIVTHMSVPTSQMQKTANRRDSDGKLNFIKRKKATKTRNLHKNGGE